METPAEPRSTQKERSIKSFAAEALHDLMHFDTKLLKTVKPLIAKPGFLTTKAFTPEQSNYVKPLALFVFINFIFFMVKPVGLFHYTLDVYSSSGALKQMVDAHIAASHLTPALFTERFNVAMKFEQQEYIIIMIPLFALFIHLLYITTKRYYTEHLIFALHFYSFAIIFLMVMPYVAILINFIISLFSSGVTVLNTEQSFDALLLAVVGTYLFLALKNVYRQSVTLTIIKALLTTICFVILILVYRYIMFFVVMHSVSEM